MGVTTTIDACLAQVETQAEAERSPGQWLWEQEAETRWHKLDHLLYLPVLGLTRPRDLYYYQGQGLQVLYGFTYKYLTVEHFLGRLTRLEIGYPLAVALARTYSQAWYPEPEALILFVDWHIKPHWTKYPAHSGHVTMWGRVMPGTKQLMLNGPEGHLLGGWNMAIDRHLSQVLVDLEANLEQVLQRPIAYTVCDSDAGGLPVGQRYAEAEQPYLSRLAQSGYTLDDFEVLGDWQPVRGDSEREVAAARWRDPVRAEAEVRDLVLMRRLNDIHPTRIYVGCLPAYLPLTEVPASYRQRWRCQERRIRELVKGANLNANFGYTYQSVPNRTRQRQWAEAQAKVEVSQQRLAQHQEAIEHLQHQVAQLRQGYQQGQQAWQRSLADLQQRFLERQQADQRVRRCQQRLARHERAGQILTDRYRRRRHKLLDQLRQRRVQQRETQALLDTRQALRDTFDTEALCRERNLEKDQVMLNLQVLLGNLHDWARTHYFAPAWQHLELDTATELIYRKPGRVHWGDQEIEVVLEPYRYPEHQQAMEETCRRFNAAHLRWRDGRLHRIHVAPDA
jgi:hypothetical protein